MSKIQRGVTKRKGATTMNELRKLVLATATMSESQLQAARRYVQSLGTNSEAA
jgi:hypothetical protein